MPNPIPGKLIFAFSYENADNGERKYHIVYNQEEDLYQNRSQLAGAILKLMDENPFLIEDFVLVSNTAANELFQLIQAAYK